MATTLNTNQNTYSIGATTAPIGSVSIGGAGGSGSYIISNGANYSNTWTTQSYDSVLIVKPEPASLEVKGRLIHNGQDLEERLKTIEKVLQIPERDVKLEAKHPKLKELYDAYIHALGKYRTWDAIKGEDND